jgi:DNA-binding response OmpR family regulator
MGKKVLSISYDRSLLLTREMLLEQAGYDVVSAHGLAEAMRQAQDCNYDLAIIGHSIPRRDKEAILKTIKEICGAPVLSLYKADEGPLKGVDKAVEAIEGPQALLKGVTDVFGKTA